MGCHVCAPHWAGPQALGDGAIFFLWGDARGQGLSTSGAYSTSRNDGRSDWSHTSIAGRPCPRQRSQHCSDYYGLLFCRCRSRLNFSDQRFPFPTLVRGVLAASKWPSFCQRQLGRGRPALDCWRDINPLGQPASCAVRPIGQCGCDVDVLRNQLVWQAKNGKCRDFGRPFLRCVPRSGEDGLLINL